MVKKVLLFLVNLVVNWIIVAVVVGIPAFFYLNRYEGLIADKATTPTEVFVVLIVASVLQVAGFVGLGFVKLPLFPYSLWKEAKEIIVGLKK